MRISFAVGIAVGAKSRAPFPPVCRRRRLLGERSRRVRQAEDLLQRQRPVRRRGRPGRLLLAVLADRLLDAALDGGIFRGPDLFFLGELRLVLGGLLLHVLVLRFLHDAGQLGREPDGHAVDVDRLARVAPSVRFLAQLPFIDVDPVRIDRVQRLADDVQKQQLDRRDVALAGCLDELPGGLANRRPPW